MPSSNVSRAIGLYRIQVSASTPSSSRNETRRFAEQSRKTRDVLKGDGSEMSFEDVMRQMNRPKH